MSLQNALKEIRGLTYKDMMVLAEELAKKLAANKSEQVSANALADILTRLDLLPAALADQEKQEHDILRKAFSRSRAITVKADNGYSLVCSTLPGSQVVGTSLREMFPQMLDQIITMEILKK